jgi:type IV pilus assembly protein PilA
MVKQAMNRTTKVLKKEKGFTLVELLATLVIIGIIAAIAVPAIGNVIDNSKDKAKVAEALMIIDAAKLAKAENPDQNTWNLNGNSSQGKDPLNQYLDKVKDTTWTVSWTETEGYKITNHDSNTVNGLNNPANEQALADATE